MKHNITFPPQKFTSPGVFTYTIRELTPTDAMWETDNRVYRAVVTVIDTGAGQLCAKVDYPDGFPRFVNEYKKPPPPSNVCKYFNCLPFPMFWFLPPQKPEFMEIMETHPDVFDKWETVLGDIGGLE